jgi:site-specific recombinase XerD
MVNRKNYMLIKEYLTYLQDTRKRARETTDRYWFWFRHLLLWADETPLIKAHTIVPSFGKYVDSIRPALALESQKKIIETVRAFFRWAKLYHSKDFEKLPVLWINDLTPPEVNQNNTLIEYVTLDEAALLATPPTDKNNIALRRDRAAAAMLFLSGVRAHAFTTLPIQAVHLDEKYPYINQWPQLGVHTKKQKKASTFLLPIPELLAVVQDWDEYVRVNCPPDYPWYAPIDQQWGDQKLSAQTPGLNRNHSLIRRIRLLYQTTELPYKSPHKFRHGYATYGLSHCQNMAEYQALSRNLMHANIAITDKTYAHMEERDRAKLLAGLVRNSIYQPEDELRGYLERLSRDDLKRATLMAVDLLSR